MRHIFIISVAIIFLMSLSINAQSGKNFKSSALPTFEESRGLLPIPVIASEPGWLEMYWFCWKEAFTKLKTPQPNSPFVANYIDEAFAPQIFQWDTHFMIQFWKYAHHIFPSIESHDNFYVCQDKDGYICREIREADGSNFFFQGKDNTINPPLFAWVEYEYYKITGDDSRFARIIPVMERYLEWIENNRKHGSRHNLYWQTNLGSGMDNSPRIGTGWVDMSTQMFMSYKALSKMAAKIGHTDKGALFQKKAEEIKKNINHWMWNENDGLYYDIQDSGEQIPVKTAACFWPMLASIASSKQAEKMMKNLQDSTSFWRLIPFPTLSADHPAYNAIDGYWLGSVWAPTNYMIIKGIEVFGFYDFSYEASVRYLRGMEAVFSKTGTVWENYNPDEYVKSKRANPDFVGWTGLGPIALLIESILGIQADASANTVQWHINRIDKHGIKNLRIGESTISLLAQARKSMDAKAIITVEANKPITLNISKAGKDKSFEVVELNQPVHIEFE